MARSLEWQEPILVTISSVEISRATNKHGSYSVIATINATSDASDKAADNTWVTTYVDSTGTFNHWYKIRFYDSDTALWSEFSDPITTGQEIKLCTIEEVKRVLDTTGRWTDTQIFNAILDVESDIYIECGTPIASIYSDISSVDSTIQDSYYVGEENIYRVDRVFYGTATMHELFQDDSFKTNLSYGMIRILPVASGGPTLNTQCFVEVRFVPSIYNRLAVYMTAQLLLETLDTVDRGTLSRELEIINARVTRVERMINNRIGLMLSSDYKHYNPVYGVNRRKIIQNHDRNKFIGSYGWT